MNNDFEKHLKKALASLEHKKQIIYGDGTCLSEESIEALCTGKMSDQDRQAALEHVDRCRFCAESVVSYMEMVVEPSAATQISHAANFLRSLKDCLPKLAAALDQADLSSLERIISRLYNSVLERYKTSELAQIAQDIESVLTARLPQLCVQVRGSQEQETTNPGQQEVTNLVQDLASDIASQMALKQVGNKPHWAGIPEIEVFSHLSEAQQNRAAKIRDYCETVLEAAIINKPVPIYPLHGIGHSKRVLKFSVDLMKAVKKFIPDDASWFFLYSAVYCRDIGLNSVSNENIEEANIGKSTYEMILGGVKALPLWPEIGFAGQQEAAITAAIAAVRNIGDLIKLPESQIIFIDNKNLTIMTQSLAAIIILADLLDYNKNRLSPAMYAGEHTRSRQEDLVLHEIVESINIEEGGRISIQTKVCYLYPHTLNIESILQEKLIAPINDLRAILKSCGIILSEPSYTTSECLFTEPHPYFGQSYPPT